MAKIKIEIPAKKDNVTKESINAFLSKFGCELVKVKKMEQKWVIQTDDSINIFWLGCNWNNDFLNELCTDIQDKSNEIQLLRNKFGKKDEPFTL